MNDRTDSELWTELVGTGPRSDGDRLTFALLLPIAVSIGLLVSAPVLGAAWRALTWAAGT